MNIAMDTQESAMEKTPQKRKSKSRDDKRKTFNAQIHCVCKRKCAERIDVVRQKDIFDAFICMKWSNKTIFIRNIVTRKRVEKENLDPIIKLKKRNFNSECFLNDSEGNTHRVCASFVLKLLQISRTKLFRAKASESMNPSATDRRGKFPTRRVKAQDREFIKSFIENYPQYESRYNMSCSSFKYLHPALNSHRLYGEYKKECELQNLQGRSNSFFQKVFRGNFNLKFLKLHTKFCNRCATFDSNLKKRVISSAHRKKICEDKQKHIDFVRNINREFENIIDKARDLTENIEILTFSMGRCFDLPLLDSEVSISNKRRIWLHCMCIFDEVRQKGHYYIWLDSVASRGSDEIASCLLRYFNDNIPEKTKQIILYSSSQNGQNRNVKLSLMLKHCLYSWPHSDLCSIEQRFFFAGHNYNRCSRSFDLIATQRRHSKNIFSQSEWIDIMKRAEPKFMITEMYQKDFVSSVPLQSLILSKHFTNTDTKINWQCTYLFFNFKIQKCKCTFF